MKPVTRFRGGFSTPAVGSPDILRPSPSGTAAHRVEKIAGCAGVAARRSLPASIVAVATLHTSLTSERLTPAKMFPLPSRGRREYAHRSFPIAGNEPRHVPALGRPLAGRGAGHGGIVLVLELVGAELGMQRMAALATRTYHTTLRAGCFPCSARGRGRGMSCIKDDLRFVQAPRSSVNRIVMAACLQTHDDFRQRFLLGSADHAATSAWVLGRSPVMDFHQSQ